MPVHNADIAAVFEEIADLLVLLASNASNFMTGAIIPVDGGAVAW